MFTGIVGLAARTVIIYVIALIVVRLMGKRALGTLSLFDFVIMVGIGDIIVLVGIEGSVPISRGVGVLAVLGGLELLFSLLTFRSKTAARILEGIPTILVEDGRLIPENMRKEHVSLSDLKQELRKQGVSRISSVERAVLEACGKFSVLLKDEVEPMSRKETQFGFAEMEAIKAEITEIKEILKQMSRENRS